MLLDMAELLSQLGLFVGWHVRRQACIKKAFKRQPKSVSLKPTLNMCLQGGDMGRSHSILAGTNAMNVKIHIVGSENGLSLANVVQSIILEGTPA